MSQEPGGRPDWIESQEERADSPWGMWWRRLFSRTPSESPGAIPGGTGDAPGPYEGDSELLERVRQAYQERDPVPQRLLDADTLRLSTPQSGTWAGPDQPEKEPAAERSDARVPGRLGSAPSDGRLKWHYVHKEPVDDTMWAECEAGLLGSHDGLTTDPAKVTCRNCRANLGLDDTEVVIHYAPLPPKVASPLATGCGRAPTPGLHVTADPSYVTCSACLHAIPDLTPTAGAGEKVLEPEAAMSLDQMRETYGDDDEVRAAAARAAEQAQAFLPGRDRAGSDERPERTPIDEPWPASILEHDGPILMGVHHEPNPPGRMGYVQHKGVRGKPLCGVDEPGDITRYWTNVDCDWCKQLMTVTHVGARETTVCGLTLWGSDLRVEGPDKATCGACNEGCSCGHMLFPTRVLEHARDCAIYGEHLPRIENFPATVRKVESKPVGRQEWLQRAGFDVETDETVPWGTFQIRSHPRRAGKATAMRGLVFWGAIARAEEEARMLGHAYVRVTQRPDGFLDYDSIAPSRVVIRDES